MDGSWMGGWMDDVEMQDPGRETLRVWCKTIVVVDRC